MQGPVPVHVPSQPLKIDPPFAGVAFKVTDCAPLNVASHNTGQLMADGTLVTAPLPEPPVATCSEIGETTMSNNAPLIVTSAPLAIVVISVANDTPAAG